MVALYSALVAVFCVGNAKSTSLACAAGSASCDSGQVELQEESDGELLKHQLLQLHSKSSSVNSKTSVATPECTYCDATGIFIKSLDDVPDVPDDATATVYYTEAAIDTGRGASTAQFNQFHSGITMEWNHLQGTDMTFQWYAANGIDKALMPTGMTALGPQWQNEAVTVYSSNINRSYWTRNTTLGKITGKSWGQFKEFLIDYAKTDERYLLWSVFNPDGTKVWPESICDSFSMKAIMNLFPKEVADGTLPPMKRNYAKLFSNEVPVRVNMLNPAEAMEVMTFYQEMGTLAAAMQSKDTPAILQIAQKVKKGDHTAFIGGYKNKAYYKVQLTAPFFKSDYVPMF